MNIQNIINTRYSTKNFDPSKKISDDDINTLKEILRLSPSSLNLQPWKFVFVQSDEGKEKLSNATKGMFEFNNHKVNQAPATVIFCAKANLDADYITEVNNKEHEDGRYATEELKNDMLGRLLNINEQHINIYGDWKTDNINQTFINVGYFLLAVAELGLDAVPIGGFDKEIISKEFNLEEQGLIPVALVSVGYHSEDDFNAKLPKSRLDNVIIDA